MDVQPRRAPTRPRRKARTNLARVACGTMMVVVAALAGGACSFLDDPSCEDYLGYDRAKKVEEARKVYERNDGGVVGQFTTDPDARAFALEGYCSQNPGDKLSDLEPI